MIGHFLAEASNDDSGAGLAVLFVIIGVSGFVAYWVPSVIAFVRGVPNKWSVAVINWLLGWTLIGWAVALSMAVRDKPDPRSQWAPQR